MNSLLRFVLNFSVLWNNIISFFSFLGSVIAIVEVVKTLREQNKILWIRICIGCFVIGVISLSGTAIRKNVVEVPNVIEHTYEDACHMLSDRGLNYTLVAGDGLYVISQNPVVGIVVKKGTIVELQTGEITDPPPQPPVYNNSVNLELVCASVLAQNTSKEFVPVSYVTIPVTDDMQCILYGDQGRYSMEIRDEKFYVSNVTPGQYKVLFSTTSRGFLFDEFEIEVTKNSEIVSNINTKYWESDYEDYNVTYVRCPNEYFVFMDKEGKKKTSGDEFQCDEKGTFHFKVMWELSPEVHVHTIKGSHLGISIDERFNNGEILW